MPLTVVGPGWLLVAGEAARVRPGDEVASSIARRCRSRSPPSRRLMRTPLVEWIGIGGNITTLKVKSSRIFTLGVLLYGEQPGCPAASRWPLRIPEHDGRTRDALDSERCDPSLDSLYVNCDGSVDVVRHGPTSGLAELGNSLVDINPWRGCQARFGLIDVVAPTCPTLKLVPIQTFKPIDHALVDRTVAIAHFEEWRSALLVEIVAHRGAGAVDAFGLGVRGQMTETL